MSATAPADCCFRVVSQPHPTVHPEHFASADEAVAVARTLLGGSVIPGSTKSNSIHYLDVRAMSAAIKTAWAR